MKAVQRCASFSRSYRTFNTSSVLSNKKSFLTEDNIIKSRLPPVYLPNVNIEEFLFAKVEKWAEKTAVICADTGRSYTFAQYEKLSEKVAQALCAKLGFTKGDVIAVFLPNVPEYLTVYCAAFKSGILLTTLNPAYTPDEIARQTKNSSVKGFITLTQTHGTIKEAIKRLNTNAHIPIITIKHEQSDTTPEGTINFQELCEYNGKTIKLETPSSEDLAILPYSSGTSGLPKGVQLIHRNIVSNLVQLQQDKVNVSLETTKEHQDVVPIMAPLYHCYGIIPVMFNMISQGCKIIMMSKYKPNLYLDMLEKYPPHLLHLVPPIVIMMINHEEAKKKHLERIRHIISAAAPLADTDIERFKEKFGHHIKLTQYYGLTETGPVSHAQHMDTEIILGSIGSNLSLTECRIVSLEDDTTNLGPNETGHLLIKGPSVMPGYYNNQKATDESIDKDGWFKSGDIGHYNEDGMFFITDRMKELIKVKGFQVAPAELEAIIRDHPNVHDAGVISIPHPQNGEAPRAFVVPRPGSNLKPEHVEEYVKERTAKHKHLIGGVRFIDTIPKNPSGKILRRLLKDMNK